MIHQVSPKSRPAALIEPASIKVQSEVADGATLLIRERPPGAVHVQDGHAEHVLFSSVGRVAPGSDARSVLSTEDGVQEWDRPPTGELTFLPAGMPLEWEWSYHSESVHLTLSRELMRGLVDQVDSETGRQNAVLQPIFRSSHEPLRHVLGRLQAEAVSQEPGHQLVLSSLAMQAAVLSIRIASAQRTAPAKQRPVLSKAQLKRALSLLDHSVTQDLSVGKLAAECGLSTYHFARAFRNTVGQPPHEFQLQRRVQRAKELLHSSPWRTIVEIAQLLGFADESHLRRHFKRIVGTTPGRFRKG